LPEGSLSALIADKELSRRSSANNKLTKLASQRIGGRISIPFTKNTKSKLKIY